MIHSYPKIYNLGHPAIKDLFEEAVTVEEKVDGSQFSFGVLDGRLVCRSRGKQIDLDMPEKLFGKAVEVVANLYHTLVEGHTYRCEYLQKPKHNTLAYDRVPRNYLIILDIEKGPNDFYCYEEKKEIADFLGLECVPLLYEGKIDTYEQFKEFLQLTSCLGGQKVEGVVIKNYVRFGRDGKALMGKYVSEDFKEVHQKDWKYRNPTRKDIIDELILQYKTTARWNKAIQHMKEAGQLCDEPKDIPVIFREINKDILKECGDEIKERLFKHFWKNISKGLTRGFPEYYKEMLAKTQFSEDTDEIV